MDDEYKRCGTANIFLCVEPLKGRTVVEATEHRAKVDFAYFIRDLCDGPYRDAYLNGIGLSVLRFSNLDVLGNMDGVITEIVQYLDVDAQ